MIRRARARIDSATNSVSSSMVNASTSTPSLEYRRSSTSSSRGLAVRQRKFPDDGLTQVFQHGGPADDALVSHAEQEGRDREPEVVRDADVDRQIHLLETRLQREPPERAARIGPVAGGERVVLAAP